MGEGEKKAPVKSIKIKFQTAKKKKKGKKYLRNTAITHTLRQKTKRKTTPLNITAPGTIPMRRLPGVNPNRNPKRQPGSMRLVKMKGIRATMHEFKQGTLRSGSGQKVTNRKQAIAIGLSEQRRRKRKKTLLRQMKRYKQGSGLRFKLFKKSRK